MAERRGVREQSGDALRLTIDYVKQETVEPLKGVGRFLAFGLASSVFVSIGTVLVLIGVLRLLQTETGLTGDLSWLPYLIVVVLAAAVIAGAVWRITSGPARRRLPADQEHLFTRPATPGSNPTGGGA
jgi:lysylphosphatidylglycerol synthetase-like protein (DUF2156 family)